jgi:hypothetical protein
MHSYKHQRDLSFHNDKVFTNPPGERPGHEKGNFYSSEMCKSKISIIHLDTFLAATMVPESCSRRDAKARHRRLSGTHLRSLLFL